MPDLTNGKNGVVEAQDVEIENLIKMEDLKGKDSFKMRKQSIDDDVREYMDILDGEASTLPPIKVFKRDGGKFLIVDGVIRVEAHKSLNIKTIKAYILEGTIEDAILEAVKTNITHGKGLSHIEKRDCVRRILNLEWVKDKSDREISRYCKVSNHLISAVKENRSSSKPKKEKTTKIGDIKINENSTDEEIKRFHEFNLQCLEDEVKYFCSAFIYFKLKNLKFSNKINAGVAPLVGFIISNSELFKQGDLK